MSLRGYRWFNSIDVMMHCMLHRTIAAQAWVTPENSESGARQGIIVWW